MILSRFSSCRYGTYAKCTCDANLLVPIDAIKCLISERMLGGKESGPVNSAAACFHTDTAFDTPRRPVDRAKAVHLKGYPKPRASAISEALLGWNRSCITDQDIIAADGRRT